MANQTIYPYGQDGELPSNIGIVNDLITGGADKALSAEQGKVIGEELYGDSQAQCDLSSLTSEKWLINDSNKWEQITTGSSRCVFLDVQYGQQYRIVNNSGRQAFFAVLAVSSGGPNNTTPSFATGTTGRTVLQDGDETTVTIPSDGESIWIRTKNSSGNDDTPNVYLIGSFAGGGIVDRVNGLEENVQDLEETVQNLEDVVENVASNVKNVYTGSFVNKKNDSTSGLPGDASTQRAGMTTTVALPYSGVTFNFKLPQNYVAGIRHGVKAQNLNVNSYWYRDEESFTFPKSSNYYRLIFAIQLTPDVSEYEDISAAEVESMIESGDIEVTYEPISLGAVQRNAPSDCYTKAVILKHTTSAESGIDKFPIFIHTSDNHGDAYRMQDAVEMAKVNNADAILFSGDIIANTINNGFDVLENVMVNSSIPSLYCRGNHETYGNSSTSFDVFSTYYSSLATKWSYLKASATVTDKTYYYMDFSSKSIRIIVLNPYEKNLTTNNAGAFSQDQIDWFISTLKSTPQGYGVLCMMHSPEAYPSTTVSIEPISGKEDFFSEGVLYWTTPTGISGMPLRDIVDAFISRTTVSFTFTQTITGGSSETITVSGDFSSGVNTGVEFIAWVTGHTHQDFIGVYKNTTNRQVVLNLTCGICYYGSSDYPHLCNGSDLPRSSFDVTQDAMNVYAIDRTNKQIRIARIGSNCTDKLTKREAMIIDYSD